MSNFAEFEFWDNVFYNASLAKCRARPRLRGFGPIMRADDVLEKLSELGVNITERTLQKYAKEGLIPMPFRKSAGRGRGRIVDYADDTPAEAYAAWLFLNICRLRYRDVRDVREKALEIEGTDAELQLVIDRFYQSTGMSALVDDWLTEKARILNGLKPGDSGAISTADFWTQGLKGNRIRKITIE
jgi:hypothetical protein